MAMWEGVTPGCGHREKDVANQSTTLHCEGGHRHDLIHSLKDLISPYNRI